MNALDGSSKKNLSNNNIEDYSPDFSPDGKKIAYNSQGVQSTNPEGDREVYSMNAADGTDKKNLSNTGAGIYDYSPDFSRDGTRIFYVSEGKQTSNLQGDYEVYRMNTLDGKGKKNLTDNRVAVDGVYVG